MTRKTYYGYGQRSVIHIFKVFSGHLIAPNSSAVVLNILFKFVVLTSEWNCEEVAHHAARIVVLFNMVDTIMTHERLNILGVKD